MNRDLLGARLHRVAWSVLGTLPFGWDQRLTAAYFERGFRGGSPWDYDERQYEVQRLAMLGELLPTEQPARILEVGCAEGHLTTRLHTLWPTSDLHVIDVSETAIDRARIRVGSSEHVSYKVTDLRAWTEAWTGPPLDLVILTDVLYYLGSARSVRRTLQDLRRHLAPGATIVLGHAAEPATWLHPTARRALSSPGPGHTRDLAGHGYTVDVLTH